MILKRKLLSKLVSRKENSKGSSAILIEGARRVGKSTIAEEFAKKYYKSYILINFSAVSKTITENFENNINNLDLFFQTLSLEYNVKLYERNSLIIFDEIQFFPLARQAIKFLVKDGRYDFLETGSLISIKENVQNIILPSEEEKIRMYPLDFEEFLRACNEELLADYIRDCFKNKRKLIDSMHKKATHLIREYMLVGGMPQSVIGYCINNKDFEKADHAKRMILSLYRDDIKKALRKYKYKVSKIFEQIPGFLSTHEKKIVFETMSKEYGSSEFEESLFWLGDSMICNLCYKCNDPNVGYSLNRNNSQVKCYLGDTGLLVSLAFSENEIMSMEIYKKIIQGKLNLNEGMLHENLVAQMLRTQNKELYFYSEYSLEKKRNDIEIDFLVTNDSKINVKISPIEVKSSKNYTKISYDKFKDKFQKRVGESYIIHPKAFEYADGKYRIPTYMVFCLFE